MNSLKKQIAWVVLGTALATVIFGVVLSIFVNIGLQQLDEQPGLLLPEGGDAPLGTP